jgi:hypothetical protein
LPFTPTGAFAWANFSAGRCGGFFFIMENLKIEKHGKYLRVIDMHDHPLACTRGRIPYHRLVLFEKLCANQYAPCHWCHYPLTWKTNLNPAFVHVINADHLDGDTTNNDPDNLVPSCWWCNANRSWAESHLVFWNNWKKWMKHIPPAMRPNLIEIAKDCGIEVELKAEDDYGR